MCLTIWRFLVQLCCHWPVIIGCVVFVAGKRRLTHQPFMKIVLMRVKINSQVISQCKQDA
jgi:hypothetical protein